MFANVAGKIVPDARTVEAAVVIDVSFDALFRIAVETAALGAAGPFALQEAAQPAELRPLWNVI